MIVARVFLQCCCVVTSEAVSRLMSRRCGRVGRRSLFPSIPSCSTCYSGDFRHSRGDTDCYSEGLRHSRRDTDCYSEGWRHSRGDTDCYSEGWRHSRGDTDCYSEGLRHSRRDTDCYSEGLRHSRRDTDCYSEGWRHSRGDTDGYSEGWRHSRGDTDCYSEGWRHSRGDTDCYSEGWRHSRGDTDCYSEGLRHSRRGTATCPDWRTIQTNDNNPTDQGALFIARYYWPRDVFTDRTDFISEIKKFTFNHVAIARCTYSLLSSSLPHTRVTSESLLLWRPGMTTIGRCVIGLYSQ